MSSAKRVLLFFAETPKIQPIRRTASSEFYFGCHLILFILAENRRSSLVTSLQTKQPLLIAVLAVGVCRRRLSL